MNVPSLGKFRLPALIVSVSILIAGPAFAELPGMDILAKLLLERFDSDHNSLVDINEWQNGAGDGFGELDHDHDGFISESEIDALADPLSEDFGRVGANACVFLIKKTLFTFDTDGDKRVSHLEYDDGVVALFKRLDTNKDGLVSQEELGELPLKLMTKK